MFSEQLKIKESLKILNLGWEYYVQYCEAVSGKNNCHVAKFCRASHFRVEVMMGIKQKCRQSLQADKGQPIIMAMFIKAVILKI